MRLGEGDGLYLNKDVWTAMGFDTSPTTTIDNVMCNIQLAKWLAYV